MKNFRKVLALVLVVATLFSFAAMASAKTLADYKDADKITTVNYEVAVEVLSALEILDGYEDDTFKPTNTITRAEMAKMIAVLANAGDADVDKLYAAACNFADVDKVNDWFASYVSYCAYTGIVSGRSADTFDPYGKVTGIETAKMLLVTMGFDADEQGYKGANWKINVLRDAQNFGLTEGFAAGYDIAEAITREEAAQMMLNALKAQTVVGLLSENIVKVTNALYLDLPIFTLKDAEHEGFKLMYGNVIVAPISLGTALYEGRLTIDTDAIDCYGRPGSKWSLINKKGTEILSGKFFADPMFASASVAMDIADVCEEELKLGYDVVTYVDGDKKTVADPSTLTGNGVAVEIYVDDAAKEIRVIIINTFFGKVTATTKAGNTFVVNGNCFSNKGYDFAEGDYVLYWTCAKHEPHAAKLATPVVATVSRVEKHADIEDSLFKADGVTYTYHKYFPILDVPAVDKDYNIYVDEYGYVIAIRPYEPETEYFYAYVVEGTGCLADVKHYGDGSYGYTATKDMVDFTASYNKDVAVDATLYALSLDSTLEEIIENYRVADKNGRLIRYTVDSEGRAVLDAMSPVAEAKLNKNGDVVTANGTIYGNDDTKYLVRTWDYEADEYAYTAYTQDTLPYTYNEGEVQYFAKTVGVKDQTVVATYVFIDSLYAEVASHAFVLKYAKSVSDSKFVKQIGAYDAYEAIIDGAEGYLLVGSYEMEPNTALVKGMVEGKMQVIGLYDDGKPVYALVENVDPTLVGETIEFIAGELVYKNAKGENVSVKPAADIFVCVMTDDGAVILESAAELNDYVETLHGFAHGTTCSGDDCDAFVFGEAWFYGDPTDELYVVVTTADELAESAGDLK